MRFLNRQFIALCFTSLMLSACAGITYHADAPSVSIQSMRLVDTQTLAKQYQLTLRVQNTNDFPLFIKGISSQLDINGSEFAYGVSPQSINLLPYSEQLIQLDLNASTLGLTNNVPQEATHYRLKGMFSHGLISVPTSLYQLPFETQGYLNFSALLKSGKAIKQKTH